MAKKKRSKYLVPAIAIAGVGVLGALALQQVSATGGGGGGGGGGSLTNCGSPAPVGAFSAVTVCTDKNTYNLGDTLNWQITGLLGISGSGVPSVWIEGPDTPDAYLTRHTGTFDLQKGTGSGSIKLTNLNPGSYLLQYNEGGYAQPYGTPPYTSFTIQSPTVAGPPKMWLATTPQGAPITSVKMGTRLYWSGSGWKWAQGGGVIATIVPGLTSSTMPFGAPVKVDGTLDGANGSGLYLNPQVWPGPQDVTVTGHNPITNETSAPFTFHIQGPGFGAGKVTFYLQTSGWNPVLNHFAVDNTRYTWTPNSGVAIPLTSGSHAITDIELLQFQDLRATLLADGDVTITSGYNFTTGGTGGSITVVVCSISSGSGDCTGMGQAPPPPPPPTPTGPVTAAINGESQTLHLPIGGGRLFFSGEGYTPYVPLVQPDPNFTPHPVVAYISSDGNYLHNYHPESFVNQGLLSGVDALGHGSGTWGFSITIDSTWHFVFWDTGRNMYSNQVDVIVGAGTPIPPGATYYCDNGQCKVSPLGGGPGPFATLAECQHACQGIGYVFPSTLPTISISGLPVDSNGLPQLHLYPNYTGGYATEGTVCFEGTGWGQNIPPVGPNYGMYLQIWVEAQNLPIPGTPNPWSNKAVTPNLSSDGTIIGSACVKINNQMWPNGQLLTFYGVLMQKDNTSYGTPVGVQSQPYQVMLV